jgi:hypothetical protein
LRQVHDVIEERQAERRRVDLAWRSEEVRTMVMFVAAASGSKELLADASRVSLLPDDEPAGEPAGPRIMSVTEARGMFRSTG